jgi:hypothetical protein
MAELPHWQPIDGVPPPMPEGSGRGQVVVLVASERAVSEGWAADAALNLARTWAGEGHRLILVDGGLQVPSLHAAAGLPNREGLTDATLYGASVGRVSQQLDDGKLFLMSAGTPVADPQSVVRSSRWHRLSAGMSEAGVTTMLYVRDGESGAAAFLGSASDIVVLGAEGELPPSVVRELEPLVRAVAGPAGGGAKAGGSKSAVAGVDEGTERERVATSSESPGGIWKMLLFLIVAVVVVAALGLVLVG